jgi:hypothetical protein
MGTLKRMRIEGVTSDRCERTVEEALGTGGWLGWPYDHPALVGVILLAAATMLPLILWSLGADEESEPRAASMTKPEDLMHGR